MYIHYATVGKVFAEFYVENRLQLACDLQPPRIQGQLINEQCCSVQSFTPYQDILKEPPIWFTLE